MEFSSRIYKNFAPFIDLFLFAFLYSLQENNVNVN